ncbi:hypothetical protein NDU88_002449 [Pleurodeles waltl]|uniref:Uncharacterized protein n=1 Tax=Pleurodeles waltl TaxID=8319 RepID=A0AAV7WQP9_PLEWA|nr:hypothetical protein NDU88_002449 [Pleurodeles waltl]
MWRESKGLEPNSEEVPHCGTPGALLDRTGTGRAGDLPVRAHGSEETGGERFLRPGVQILKYKVTVRSDGNPGAPRTFKHFNIEQGMPGTERTSAPRCASETV